MSLFELMGEMVNPGDVGSVNFGAPNYHYKSKAMVLFKCIVAAIFLTFTVYYFTKFFPKLADSTYIKVALGFALYLMAGYYIHPTPDTSNLGWLGGLMDNPFRISDDINWLLIWFKVLLWPGLFISSSLVGFVKLVLADPSLLQPPHDPFQKSENPSTQAVPDPPLKVNSDGEIPLVCPGGHDFTVARMYTGTLRPCPTCNEKTQVP